MAINKKIYVLGGGTVFHVAPHLALTAPAYGTTARRLAELCKEEFQNLDVELHLTKMAGGKKLETNAEVEAFVDQIVNDHLTKIVFFNVAMTDFAGDPWTLTKSGKLDDQYCTGKYAQRFDSSRTDLAIQLTPARKVIDRIRKTRKDITLVGFKTTCNATEDEQYIAGLNLLKKASCNLVLANDLMTRTNMVITPEEARYHVTKDRDEALRGLVQMTNLRSHLTFTRSTVVAGEAIPWQSELVPENLRKVVDHCIAKGAYKPFRGATVGHFAAKVNDTTFITSKRKTNFNDLDKLGLVRIQTDGPDSVVAYGSKPSVGGQSQRIVFDDHKGYDCIVHFHCPIKPGSMVPTVSQREFECGSHECGKNTSNGLGKFWLDWDQIDESHPILAVYLDQHGPNIVFHSYTSAHLITKFIDENFDLSQKTGGFVELPKETK